jgi:hypothetical protein
MRVVGAGDHFFLAWIKIAGEDLFQTTLPRRLPPFS